MRSTGPVLLRDELLAQLPRLEEKGEKLADCSALCGENKWVCNLIEGSGEAAGAVAMKNGFSEECQGEWAASSPPGRACAE